MAEIAGTELETTELFAHSGGRLLHPRFNRALPDKLRLSPGQNMSACPFVAFCLVLMPPPQLAQGENHFLHVRGRFATDVPRGYIGIDILAVPGKDVEHEVHFSEEEGCV